MSDQSTNTNDWQPCASGQITGMVQRLQAEQRSSTIRRMVGPVAAVLLLVAAGVYLHQSQPGGLLFHPGGLSCQDVHGHLPSYAKQQLSPELSEQIEEHLADCPECRKAQEMMGGRAAGPTLQVRARSDRDREGLAVALTGTVRTAGPSR
jgi:hypothetical protein